MNWSESRFVEPGELRGSSRLQAQLLVEGAVGSPERQFSIARWNKGSREEAHVDGLRWVLLVRGIIVALCAGSSGAATAAPALHGAAVGGVRLGTSVKDLKARYPKLYVHSFPGGEVLYEACNQRTLQVFTYVEQPWARGRIGEVGVREADEGTCRDENGQLPDLNLAPATDRHVRLGDTEHSIILAYGSPDERAVLDSGKTKLSYHLPSEGSSKLEGHLVFIMTGDHATSIMASYDAPAE